MLLPFLVIRQLKENYNFYFFKKGTNLAITKE